MIHIKKAETLYRMGAVFLLFEKKVLLYSSYGNHEQKFDFVEFRVQPAFCFAGNPLSCLRLARDFSRPSSVLKEKPPIGGFSFGADDGNRTRVFGLGSGHSAIELHLRSSRGKPLYYNTKCSHCQDDGSIFCIIFSPFFAQKPRFFAKKSRKFTDIKVRKLADLGI